MIFVWKPVKTTTPRTHSVFRRLQPRRRMLLMVMGSTISFQQDGATRITVTDSTLTGGAPGVMTYGAATADNWAGSATGSPPPPPSTYSVGGTVSGLSGTVVLQDNGGDDLSVSSNGAFAFATRLASGAAYNVTVKTNPSGQTCQVSGGTGTVASANVTNVAATCTATSAGLTARVRSSCMESTMKPVLRAAHGGLENSDTGERAIRSSSRLPWSRLTPARSRAIIFR